MKRKVFALVLAALLCAGAGAEDVLILPEDTKIIESEAFRGTANLGKVVLPEGLEEIHSHAFADCSLSEINLPESLETIADDAFAGCEGAKFTAVEGSYAYDWAVENGYISFESITLGDLTFLVGAHSATVTDCSSNAVEVTVPAAVNGVPVTCIGESAFGYCESLEKVNLPETITSIEDSAFYGCSALTGIEIPAGVEQLPGSVFRYCKALSRITLHEGLRSIGYMCFEDCWNLASIVLPEGLVELGAGAFNNCQGLEEVALPESLTTIGANAFRYCIAIERLVIPKAVNSIGNGAFTGCSLTAVVDAGTFPNGSYASRYCSQNGIPYETY